MLIVLDTETSDLDPSKGAEILELAWVELKHNGQQWSPTQSFEIYLQYDGYISPHAQAVHHIPRSKLTAEAGAYTKAQALELLLSRVTDDTLFVAHNAEFDSKFLPQIKKPWICTLRAARHIWPQAPGHSNQVLRYWLGLQPETGDRYPHQALYDVMTTADILMKMLEQYPPEQLLHLSRAPLRLKSLGFGKHKGVPLEQIPRDYLQWLRNQNNLDNDLRHTLDSFLK